MIPIQFVYTENGKEKSSLDEHNRRVEIAKHNQELIITNNEKKEYIVTYKKYSHEEVMYRSFEFINAESEEQAMNIFNNNHNNNKEYKIVLVESN